MDKKGTILIADDTPIVIDFLLDVFDGFFPDYNVESFSDGISLNKRLDEGISGVKLILTDNKMPGRNGLEIIKEYSRRENYSHIPFLLYTSDSNDVKEYALRVGASASLEKTLNLQKLTQTIGSFL